MKKLHQNPYRVRYLQHLRLLCAALITAVLLLGCASRPQLGDPGCYPLQETIIPSTFSDGSADAPLHPRSASLFASLDKVDIIALSGGGQNGTFGAGYLIGWKRSGSMPEFEYVTGVSAGALLATQVFIDDVESLSAFEGLTERDLVRVRYFGSLFSDALLDNAPLRKEIAALNDASTLEEVAAKSRTGAILQVGVVSLDSGNFIPVNLGALAQDYVDETDASSKSILHDLYIEAVLASTAIPLMMPPSYLNCEMMVDGGARNQLFIEDTLARLRQTLGGSPAEQIDNVAITALLNGLVVLDLSADGFKRAEPNLVSIGGRSISAMLDSSLDNDIFRFCNNPWQGDVDIISMDQIPSANLDVCEKFTGGFFNGDFMSCIYLQGLELGEEHAVRDCAEVMDKAVPTVR